jgi:hypothetical protein
MARKPFPVLLPKFARTFGPPLLVVAAAGLLGALKAPPQPPLQSQTGRIVYAAPEPPSSPPSSKGGVVENHAYRLYSGEYRVGYYGLKMRIPEGFMAFDAGFSHFGFTIPLERIEGETPDQAWARLTAEGETPVITLSLNFNSQLYPPLDPPSPVVRETPIRLVGLDGRRTVTHESDNPSPDSWVTDKISLGGQSPAGNPHFQEGRPVETLSYFFYLRTTEKRYKEDVKVFEKILSTWRPLK